MRQRRKNDIAFLNDFFPRPADDIAEVIIGRVDLTELFPRITDRAGGGQLRLRVLREDPRQLRAGIAGRTDNSRLNHFCFASRSFRIRPA